MQLTMGKLSKNSSLETLNQNGKRIFRDAFLEESSESSFGPELHFGRPDSSSSSVEESDIDSSSDSMDSGISCRHRRFIKAKSHGVPFVTSSPNHIGQHPPLFSPYTMMQIDSSLSHSLDNKMHIHQKVAERLAFSPHDEPSQKKRKLLLNLQEEKARRGNVHHYGSTQGVLGENLIGRNDYEESLMIDLPRENITFKGTPDYSLRNGDIAALLSPNTHSIARKRTSSKKPSLHQPFPQVSKDGKTELRILVQPEEQHRARYMTEGSRGSIKDEKGTGFPTVKLFGYQQPVILQIFIGCDQGKVQPHLFYQACKVTGKNCTPCVEKLIDGTCVIEIQLDPANDMTVSCDCIGILKERNVDVEQRLPYFGLSRCKKRSTKCRMVFRVNIPTSSGSFETLQMSSSPILCTQSPGLPEVCKKSLSECSVKGGSDLFIIGKNFQKDARVVFTEIFLDHVETGGVPKVLWEESVEPEKEYVHQSHLVCCVPPYRDQEVQKAVKVMLTVCSGGKSSEPHIFTYTPHVTVYKENAGNLKYIQDLQNTQCHHQVTIKQEWDGDVTTSEGSSSPSIPNVMGGVTRSILQQPIMMDSLQASLVEEQRMSSNSLMSMSLPSLQHLVTSSAVGSDMASIVTSPTMAPTIQSQQLPTAYSLMDQNQQINVPKAVEENHSDVDLISGINQLASEIVKEQQQQQHHHQQQQQQQQQQQHQQQQQQQQQQQHQQQQQQQQQQQMLANIDIVPDIQTSTLNSMGPTIQPFSQENCYSLASSDIKHTLSSFEQHIPLSNSVVNHSNDMFMTSASSAPICSTTMKLNNDKVSDGLYAAVNSVELAQKGPINNYLMPSNMTVETSSHLLTMSETVSLPNVGGVEYTSPATCTSSVGLIPDCQSQVMAIAQIHLQPYSVSATSTSSEQPLPLPVVTIKSESEAGHPIPATTARSNEMAGYQQSISYAFSQLSDADLLSLINPKTFDVV